MLRRGLGGARHGPSRNLLLESLLGVGFRNGREGGE